MPDYTTAGYRCLPTGAAGVTVSTAAANTWSAWVEISSSLPQASQVVGVQGMLNMPSDYAVIEVGVGAASFEVPIGSVRIGYLPYGANVFFFSLPINVASGARVSVRFQRSAGASGTDQFIKLLYIPDQETTIAEVAADQLSTARVSATGGSPAFANGSWVEIIAAAASDLAISSITAYTFFAQYEYEMDIGVGGSGSEVVVATYRWISNNAFVSANDITPPTFPLAVVSSGDRVAVRLRTNAASGPASIALNYCSLPLP